MRRRYPVILLVVLIVAIALSAALATSDASATPTWTCGGASCHGTTATAASRPAHGAVHRLCHCASCHTDGAGERAAAVRVRRVSPRCSGQGTHASAAGTGCNAYTPCHGGASPSPSPTPTDTGTPSPTPTATDTPTPTPSATDDGSGTGGVTDDDADGVGFPATGYPPSDGGSTPWLLITGAFAAGLAMLFAVWRIPAARRRD